MAESKQQDQDKPQTKNLNPSEEQIKGDVHERMEEANRQGFFGVKVDPRPNSDYSLESGPDSPPTHDDDRTRNAQLPVTPKETS